MVHKGRFNDASEVAGEQGITEEDRSYQGGRYAEVNKAVFANPYQKVWGGKDEPLLPVYKATLSSVLAGVLPFGKSYQFLEAGYGRPERTV